MTTYEYGRNVLTDARMRLRVPARAGLAAFGRGWRKVRGALLPLAGLGCFVASAFTVSLLAGLIAAGVACFVAEWRFAK